MVIQQNVLTGCILCFLGSSAWLWKKVKRDLFLKSPKETGFKRKQRHESFLGHHFVLVNHQPRSFRDAGVLLDGQQWTGRVACMAWNHARVHTTYSQLAWELSENQEEKKCWHGPGTQTTGIVCQARIDTVSASWNLLLLRGQPLIK